MKQRQRPIGSLFRVQPAPIEKTLQRFDWFTEMRTTNPVFYNEEKDLWEIFLYDDVNRAITDHSVFSNAEIPGFTDTFMERTLIMKDPPDHRKLRNLVNLAFTPRAVNHLSGRITQVAQELLDPFLPLGKMDIVSDIAFPLPAKVIATMLGVPDEDWDIFRRWVGDRRDIDTSSIVVRTPEDVAAMQQKTERQMYDYFARLLDERRSSPREDLISSLSIAEVDGERLDTDDLVSFCLLLLGAGQETTKNLIANAIYCFTEYPDATARLIEHPELMPIAIEEILRFMPPVWFIFRRTVKAVELAGQRIPADELIQIWQASANRDPAQFPDPARFDIQRSPNRHVGFGHGIHFCVGAPLARLEAAVLLPMMLKQLHNLQRVPDAPINVVASIVYIIQSLSVTFTAPHNMSHP